MLTAVGIPVYFHYCGGELEEINYVLKGSSCCGGEEDDSAEEDNGCCKDENYILKSNIDFTFKELQDYTFVKSFSQLFYISLPFSFSLETNSVSVPDKYLAIRPTALQQQCIISTSVLRI